MHLQGYKSKVAHLKKLVYQSEVHFCEDIANILRDKSGQNESFALLKVMIQIQKSGPVFILERF